MEFPEVHVRLVEVILLVLEGVGGGGGGRGLAICAEFLGLLDNAKDDLDKRETQLVLDYVGAVEAVYARDSHNSILCLQHLP